MATDGTDQPDGPAGEDDAPREVLTEAEELLYRQIALPLREGRPSWEVFKGRKDEDWQVSVDRESLVDDMKASFDRHTEDGATSHGVVAVSVGDLEERLVEAYSKPLPENPAHSQYDLQTLNTGANVSHGVREKICVTLLDKALAPGRPQYFPPSG